MGKRGRPRKVVEQEKVFDKKVEKEERNIVYTSEDKNTKEDIQQYRFYVLCPFCKHKNLKHLGRDPDSTWCENCGKCILLAWQKEFI